MTGRRLLATLAGVATTVLAAVGGAHGGDVADDAPTGPLAAEMTAALEQHPGGVQVSDNAMAWDDGAIVVVWPDPGETVAPFGLGDGVRPDVVAALGLEASVRSASRTGDVVSRASALSCTPGRYCFYPDANFGGVRSEFSTTCSAYAGASLDGTTSSWVNRNPNRNFHVYDYFGGPRLWTMPAGTLTSDAYLGAADNRLSYWTCTNV